jgi:hypothetical protein
MLILTSQTIVFSNISVQKNYITFVNLVTVDSIFANITNIRIKNNEIVSSTIISYINSE